MRQIRSIFLVSFVFIAFSAFAQSMMNIDTSGIKLQQFYKKLNVENLWQKGVHVNWETGEADNPDATKNIKTHCSSFAAAACKWLNIYLLHPPEHNPSLLANAQYNWLSTPEAANDGWKKLPNNDYKMIQEKANNGFVVIAVWKNPSPHLSGHIALIMPQNIDVERLSEKTIKIIQAGRINSSNISLAEGFEKHIISWQNSSIVFYYNEHKIEL